MHTHTHTLPDQGPAAELLLAYLSTLLLLGGLTTLVPLPHGTAVTLWGAAANAGSVLYYTAPLSTALHVARTRNSGAGGARMRRAARPPSHSHVLAHPPLVRPASIHVGNAVMRHDHYAFFLVITRSPVPPPGPLVAPRCAGRRW